MEIGLIIQTEHLGGQFFKIVILAGLRCLLCWGSVCFGWRRSTQQQNYISSIFRSILAKSVIRVSLSAGCRVEKKNNNKDPTLCQGTYCDSCCTSNLQVSLFAIENIKILTIVSVQNVFSYSCEL